MEQYKLAFLQFLVKRGALKFGRFELRSKRISPYFVNTGNLNLGSDLYALSEAYAKAILASGVTAPILFGPAYKGIPLAATIAMRLSAHGVEVSFSADRKEEKDHGEGGGFLGAKPSSDTIIVDDVITRGDAKRGAIDFVRSFGGTPKALFVAFDRMERISDEPNAPSAMQEIERMGIRTFSVVTVQELLTVAKHDLEFFDDAREIERYLEVYGVKG